MAKHLTIAEFMSTQVATVQPDTSLLTIARIMEKQDISSVIVCEQRGGNTRPVGIVTEKNIVSFIATQPDTDVDTIPASTLMPATLVTIHADDSLFAAMVLCRSQRVKHLAVIDGDEQLAGIMTYSDLVDANYMQIEREAEMIGNADDKNAVNSQLLEMTLTDPMLKIGNRRSMEIDLKQTFELAQRYQRPFAIALIDIDHFKQYNDHYGHQQGDQALIATTRCLQNCIRGVDRLYRYGGEEFLLLMPETDDQAAEIVTQRLVDAVAALDLPHEKSPFGKLTISTGASSLTSPGTNDKANDKESTESLIKTADEALYYAKGNGRNQSQMLGYPRTPTRCVNQ